MGCIKGRRPSAVCRQGVSWKHYRALRDVCWKQFCIFIQKSASMP